jgi:hypothetical protein
MPAKITYAIFLLVVVLLSGCASRNQGGRTPSENQQAEDHPATKAYLAKVESLQVDLAALNRQANLMEARQVARTAIQYSYFLVEKYELVRPAVLHNVLVRVGIKQRGLCHHWTSDLMAQLEQLELKTYQLYWGVAHRGSELREHNSVVVAARGKRFEEGIVLDPWRNSGELYWTPVRNDRYPWKERPRSEW